MKKQMGFAAWQLIVVVFGLLLIGGWIANVVKLIHAVGGDVTTMFILRIVGVFAAPLGSILGFL